jgi:hypothetical protein
MVSRGKQPPYLGELVELDGNGQHRRQSYGIKTSRSRLGRVTDVNWAAMDKIGKTVWSSLSLGPILAAQGLGHLIAQLLAYAYPVPA